MSDHSKPHRQGDPPIEMRERHPRNASRPCSVCGWQSTTRCRMCQAERCSMHAAHLCGPIPPALIEVAGEVIRPHVAALSIAPRIVSTAVDLGGVRLAIAHHPTSVIVAAPGLAILAELALADAAERIELSREAALERPDVVAHVAGTVAELAREMPIAAAAVAVRAIGTGVDLLVVSAPLGDHSVDGLVDRLNKFSPLRDGTARGGGSPCRPRSGLSDLEANE